VPERVLDSGRVAERRQGRVCVAGRCSLWLGARAEKDIDLEGAKLSLSR
jgi:hypothetical protein